jgi:small subunit ribosomal protein S17
MTEKVKDTKASLVQDVSSSSDGGQQRGRRKVREGYVISDKMDKTVVVAVEDRVKHRLYGKVVRQTSRLRAHDEENSAALGDRVRVMETRPLSATKRWRLVEILEKAK